MLQFLGFDGASLSNVVLNDDHYPTKRFVTNVAGRLDKTNKVQDHGIWPAYTYLGERNWEIEGDILGISTDDYIRLRLDLMAAFTPDQMRNTQEVGTLRFIADGIGEELSNVCGLEGMPDCPIEANYPTIGEYHIQLVGFDPTCYGSAVRTAITGTPLSSVTGLAFPRVFPISFPVTSSGGEVILRNNGNAISRKIVAKINGPSVNPRLQHRDTAGVVREVIFSDLSIAAGNYVRVDFLRKTAKMQDGTSVYYALDHRRTIWWGLVRGDNTVNYLATSATAPSNVEWEYYNAYMF